MTRHLDHLKHLAIKLQGRYGEADPHVQEVITQLQGLEASESRQRAAGVTTKLVSSEVPFSQRNLGRARPAEK